MSVADFYLAFSWGKVKECVEESRYLFCLGFSEFLGSQEIHRIFTGKYLDIISNDFPVIFL